MAWGYGLGAPTSRPRRWLPLLVVALLLAGLLGPSIAGARAAQPPFDGATLRVLAPGVAVAVAGSGASAPGTEGQALGAGDTVRTGPSGAARLTFFDGSTVQLAADTTVQVRQASASQGVTLVQTAGTTLNRVPPRLAGSPGFTTETPAAVALVRGTTTTTTTYVVDVGRGALAGGLPVARAARARLSPVALGQWQQAAAATDGPLVRSLALGLTGELAPVLVPGAPAGPSTTGGTTQASLAEVRGTASATALLFPRAVAESPYLLLRDTLYEAGGSLWRVRSWADPATASTWDTFDRLGSVYPRVGEALYAEADGSLVRVRTWRDAASGATWDTFENLGVPAATGLSAGGQQQQAALVGAARALRAQPLSTEQDLTTVTVLDGTVDGTASGTGDTFTLGTGGVLGASSGSGPGGTGTGGTGGTGGVGSTPGPTSAAGVGTPAATGQPAPAATPIGAPLPRSPSLPTSPPLPLATPVASAMPAATATAAAVVPGAGGPEPLPTSTPTVALASTPTVAATSTLMATATPTATSTPTATPTSSPTVAPTSTPTATATAAPTTIAVGANPDGVAVNASTNRVYVANSSDGTVSVINSTSNTIVDTVAVGSPRGVAVNAATNKVYVTNFGSNTVSVIDANNGNAVTTVNVGGNPRGVAVKSTTNRVYVANSSDGTVSVFGG